MVAVFQGRPKNHQRHRFDDGRFRIQWLVVVALDNEVCGAAFKEQKALTERLFWISDIRLDIQLNNPS